MRFGCHSLVKFLLMPSGITATADGLDFDFRGCEFIEQKLDPAVASVFQQAFENILQNLLPMSPPGDVVKHVVTGGVPAPGALRIQVLNRMGVTLWRDLVLQLKQEN
jgi:hypothetical protein